MNELSFRLRDVAHAITAGRTSRVTAASSGVSTTRRDATRPVPLGGTLKRGIDVAVASIGLIVAAPVILLLGLAVRLQDGGPMFYAHTRIGYGNRPFQCLKLRTMVMNGDAVLRRHFESNPEARAEWERTRKLKDDPRITPLGRFLRRTSLDELPQIFNILRGDMTLVGPRPVTAAELADHYGPATRYYTAARPGLTGLWQISGRSEIDYGRRVAFDTLYVRRWSLLLDLSIAVRTPAAVLASRGSY